MKGDQNTRAEICQAELRGESVSKILAKEFLPELLPLPTFLETVREEEWVSGHCQGKARGTMSIQSPWHEAGISWARDLGLSPAIGSSSTGSPGYFSPSSGINSAVDASDL